jgi:hypothetical protein
MLGAGAAIEADGAGALELPEEAVSLLPQAVSVSAAAAVRPIPAIRSLVTKIHSNAMNAAEVSVFVAGGSTLEGEPDWSIGKKVPQAAVKVTLCQPVAPSGTVPARMSVWV